MPSKVETHSTARNKTLRVAAIQLVSNDDVVANLKRILALVEEVVQKEKTELLVLPENALCFGAKPNPQLNADIESAITALRQLCRKLRVVMVAGSIPLPYRQDNSLVEGRYRSASLVFDAQGAIKARYDKIHMFDVDVADGHGQYRESRLFEPGDEVVVAEMTDYRLGLAICYDLRFPELFSALRKKGAEIIALPSAFTKVTGEAHWEVLVRARAIETQCFLIAANQGGQHSESRETWGQSMIVDPWGQILAECQAGEGYCVADIELSRLEDIRGKIPVSSHRRIGE